MFNPNIFLVRVYLFKVNNENTRKMCEICWKLTIETPEWRLLVSLLLPLNRFHTWFWCFHCLYWTIKCRLAWYSYSGCICWIFCIFRFCLIVLSDLSLSALRARCSLATVFGLDLHSELLCHQVIWIIFRNIFSHRL